MIDKLEVGLFAALDVALEDTLLAPEAVSLKEASQSERRSLCWAGVSSKVLVVRSFSFDWTSFALGMLAVSRGRNIEVKCLVK